MTEADLRRRFFVLTLLRWFGTGMIVPVLVLVITDSGLTVADAGLVFLSYGVATTVLELPTGGLADALGRRPVLVVSAVLFVVFDGLLLVADSLEGFVLAGVVGGIGRALSSGPLEAWYVDEIRRLEPDRHLRGDLGRAGALGSVGLLIGALVSVAVANAAASSTFLGIGVARGPVAAAAVADGVLACASWFMLVENRSTRMTVGGAIREVPLVVIDGLATVRRSTAVRRLLLASLVGAIGFVAIELLWQPRVVELLNDREKATRVAGLFVVAISAAGFVGALLASAIPDRFVARPNRGAASFVAVGVVGFGVLAAAGNVWWFAGGLVIVYGGFAASGVFVDVRLHDSIEERQRATMLSVQSMSLQFAGAVTGLLIARFADATSIPTALAVAGVVAAVGIPVLLTVPGGPDGDQSPITVGAVADSAA